MTHLKKSKRLLKCVILLSLLAAFGPVQASGKTDWTDKVRKGLVQAIADSTIPKSQLGVWVSYDDGCQSNRIYELNGEKKFVPASLTKLVTAAAALEKFPIGHQFKTQLVTSAPIEDGVLKGDLYIKGGGDPGFVSESMWILVNEFMRSGIGVVKGNVIVDDTRFDKERYDSGRDPERVDRAYDAPIGAMSFNWNSVNVYIRPGRSAGDPVQVFADPDNRYIRVVNKAKTVEGSVRALAISRQQQKKVSKNGDGLTPQEIIVVSGRLGVEQSEVVSYKSITKPDVWTGYHLFSFLQRRGVEVAGRVKTGRAPASSRVLAEVNSRPLKDIVADMMKFSNNYVAEMLTKNLAAEHKGEPGTMDNALVLLREYLSEVQLESKYFSLVNASGLSRRNKFRPKDIHRLLSHMRSRFTVFPEFLSSLPIAGIDGTLKSRLNDSAAQGWVRAKTGMLNGVLGLAGYAGRQTGEILPFVILFNGSAGNRAKALALFDRLALTLVE